MKTSKSLLTFSNGLNQNEIESFRSKLMAFPHVKTATFSGVPDDGLIVTFTGQLFRSGMPMFESFLSNVKSLN